MVMQALAWIVVLAVILVVILAAVLPIRRGRSLPARRVANSRSLLALSLVRQRLSARRTVYAVLGAFLAVATVGAALVSGRPVERTVTEDTLANRDIVLCLDVSVSMLTMDSAILDTFSALLEGFHGERVALVVWNSTAQTMVPLTDDYELLRDTFDDLVEDLDFDPDFDNDKLLRYYDTFNGTLDENIQAASLAGDGLASCALAFDNQTQERDRSIILATDNQVNDPYGLQIFSVQEAADLVDSKDIRLFSLFASDPEYADPDVTGKDVDQARDELREVTQSHGGTFTEIDDADAAGSIVTELESKEVENSTTTTKVREADVPEVGAAFLTLALLGFLGVAAWRRA